MCLLDLWRSKLGKLHISNLPGSVQSVIGGQSLVVIGNGMASYALCRWLTDELGPSRDRSITVFGDEPRPAYDRVNLTDFFAGKSAQDLELASREWYAERGIELRTGEQIVSIDRAAKHVLSTDGTRYAYDQLVLATGSRPFVPSIPGVDNDGVFVYRTIEDLQAIADWGRRAKSAAVLGGGLLGLEAAKALQEMSLVTHVVEMAPSLMPRQLDRDGGLALRHRIERLGVQIHLPKRTESIERHGDFLMVQFGPGDSLAVDMVVISAGIRPRDELAREAGLKVGVRGGIVVDDSLQTNDPSIFAIGECAAHKGIVYGLVGPCYQMAKVLADRLRGQDEWFTSGDRSARLKLLGVDVATFGEPLGEASGALVLSGKTETGSCRKLLIRDQRIVGALAVGDWPEASRVQAAVTERSRPWGWQLRRFQKTGVLWRDEVTQHVADWPPEALVCSCLRVTRSALTTACQQGCTTADELADATGASTVCGSCRPLLAQMIGQSEKSLEAIAGSRGLLVTSLAVLAVLGVFALVGPIEFSKSVVGAMSRIDFIWRDEFWKQVTGYTLIGITVLTLLLSLRKRWKRLRIGDYGFWRVAHAALGVASLLGVLVHTGLHMGSNLNFLLMSCFVGINLIGGLTGVVTSLESRASAATALVIRQWRPRITLLHILLFWPLPVLVAAHIFCVYYY